MNRKRILPILLIAGLAAIGYFKFLKPKPVPGDFARQLAGVLKTATNGSWDVEMRDAPSEPSLLQQEQAAAQAARDEILNAPMVAAVRSAFPDAELIEDTRSLS